MSGSSAPGPAPLYPDAFFLYAETYLPHDAARSDTLNALKRCAEGTARETPDVVTYFFRPSPLTEMIGRRTHPQCVALESTELYLTPAGFREHLTTPEFREGLRAMYRGTRRLGARIFWIGATPASDMMHNIFRSDPQARPIAAVVASLFNPGVAASAPAEDAVLVSMAAEVASGDGARAIDTVRALHRTLTASSFVAFFHPLAPEMMRIFFVAPLTARQPPTRLGEDLAALGAPDSGMTQVRGVVSGARARQDLAAAVAAAPGVWTLTGPQCAGHVLHPAFAAQLQRGA